jgi:hypothetical protein
MFRQVLPPDSRGSQRVSGRQQRKRGRARRTPRDLACLAAIGLLAVATGGTASAQTLTADMFRPERDGFSGQRRPASPEDASDASLRRGTSAPSRINNLPTFDAPAASGASTTGFDSLGRHRRKTVAKRGAAMPPPARGRTPATTAVPVRIAPVAGIAAPPQPLPPPVATTPNRARLAPSITGTVEGQPRRRVLRVDNDPFGAVGFYAGSMLLKPAIELWGGYDTNPNRVRGGKPSWLYMVSPELQAASDWERHSLTADLRGSYTGYSLRHPAGCDCVSGNLMAAPLPVEIDRPAFTGRVNGRFDVSRDTRILGEARMAVGTDNPGSPNIESNLQRYPLFNSYGGTLGGAHNYNRFELSANGSVDRTVYQMSTLSNGHRFGNEDRNFNQYAGTLRGGYEVTPEVKPFGEVTLDRRERDEAFDRNGYYRSSRATTVRAGSTFELGRLITGEASIGYTMRTYEDPRLRDLNGLLFSASLIWKPTGLTTVTLAAQSTVDETTVPGVSGVLNRSYNATVEHAFRRYLIGTLKAGIATADYDGSNRSDTIYSVGSDLVYKFNREMQLKAQLRHDWMKSSIASLDYQATLFMLGMRFQR